MTPPTIDQLRDALRTVQSLGDPLIEWELVPVFGGECKAFQLDVDRIYVSLHSFTDETVLCVKRFFLVSKSEEAPKAAPTFTLPAHVMRWTLACPPWGTTRDLPTLAMAIKMLRLPDSAFPPPGEVVEYEGASGPVEYTDSFRVRIGEAEIPLWRFLTALGRLT